MRRTGSVLSRRRRGCRAAGVVKLLKIRQLGGVSLGKWIRGAVGESGRVISGGSIHARRRSVGEGGQRITAFEGRSSSTVI